MKVAVLFFVLIFLLNFFIVDGLKIGISPSQVELHADESMDACVNFTLSSDRDVEFDISSFWSDSDSRKLGDYILYPAEKGISFSYNSLNRSGDKSNYQMCLIGVKAGEYYGVLLAKVLAKNAAVGMWVDFEVKGENVFERLSDKITGDVLVLNGAPKDGKNFAYPDLLLLFSIFLSFVFLVLILMLVFKRTKNKI